MSKISNTEQARAAIGRDGRRLMLTHRAEGDSFGLDTGQAVPAKVVRALQSDLFVRPSEDGLFPGCSQTWTITE